MKIKIGTRKSKLALAQTNMVICQLQTVFPGLETEIVHITTSGDRITDRPLHEIGGKGLFIGEIERALLEGKADLAVHSAKDLPVQLADGTKIGAVLKRGNPRDVLVMRADALFGENEVFTVGTGSQRRRNALAQVYVNAVFSDIRGNIDTRLRKLEDGEYDAIVLAAAGLERLGLNVDSRFKVREMSENTEIPAPCQGIIAVQSRDGEFSGILEKINHDDTYKCFETEREVLRLLNAGCTLPVGAYAHIDGDRIKLTATKNSLRKVVDSADVSERFALAERVVEQL